MLNNFYRLSLIAFCTIAASILAYQPAQAIQLAVLYDYENAGSIALDVSGNGNNGTVNGSVTSAPGRNGSSLGAQFPGIAANNISRGALAGGYDGMPGMTMISWVWVDSTNNTYNGIISQGGAAHRMMDSPGGHPFLSAPDTGSSASLPYDTWFQLAVTKQNNGANTDAIFYVNGQATVDSPKSLAGNLPDASAFSMFVGAGENTNAWPLKGFLDDTAIFDGALTGPQVAATYNMAVAPGLNYNLLTVNSLLELYEAQTGTVSVGSLTWNYATGLSGTPGTVQQNSGIYFIVLDQLGNGLQADPPPAPEPSTLLLLGLGALGLARRTKKRQPRI